MSKNNFNSYSSQTNTNKIKLSSSSFLQNNFSSATTLPTSRTYNDFQKANQMQKMENYSMTIPDLATRNVRLSHVNFKRNKLLKNLDVNYNKILISADDLRQFHQQYPHYMFPHLREDDFMIHYLKELNRKREESQIFEFNKAEFLKNLQNSTSNRNNNQS